MKSGSSGRSCFGAKQEQSLFNIRHNPAIVNPVHPLDGGGGQSRLMEGRRPLLTEIQALVAPSALAQPRRATSGLESARVAMVLAVGSRFTFIYINHLLLGVPSLAKNSTTITALITAFSYLFIILANYWILKETITINQIAGAVLIVAGIVIILWK